MCLKFFTAQKRKKKKMKNIAHIEGHTYAVDLIGENISSSLRSQGLYEFMFQLQRFLLIPQNEEKNTMLLQSLK